jgi:hypothetical protein
MGHQAVGSMTTTCSPLERAAVESALHAMLRPLTVSNYSERVLFVCMREKERREGERERERGSVCVCVWIIVVATFIVISFRNVELPS